MCTTYILYARTRSYTALNNCSNWVVFVLTFARLYSYIFIIITHIHLCKSFECIHLWWNFVWFVLITLWFGWSNWWNAIDNRIHHQQTMAQIRWTIIQWVFYRNAKKNCQRKKSKSRLNCEKLSFAAKFPRFLHILVTFVMFSHLNLKRENAKWCVKSLNNASGLIRYLYEFKLCVRLLLLLFFLFKNGNFEYDLQSHSNQKSK